MEEPKARRRPILVLGIDRSGTSLLSEVLFRWGAYPGAMEQLPKADAGNPQGYWEYQPMEDFLSSLIASTGLATWDPQFKQMIKQQAFDPEWRRRALELAAEMECQDRPWFWKEPDIVFVLPFWLEILTDPVFLITLRNPCNSALSYERFFLSPILRDKLQLTSYFFLRWQYLMVSILDQLKDYRSKLVVSYEALVSFPREQCERICRFLAAEYGLEAGDPGKVERMAQAIDRDLWRNHSEISFLETQKASAAQKELYSYLSSHLDGEVGDFDPSRYPFPECWREYFSNMSVLRWLFQNL